jgi:hypothetical protein
MKISEILPTSVITQKEKKGHIVESFEIQTDDKIFS